MPTWTPQTTPTNQRPTPGARPTSRLPSPTSASEPIDATLLQVIIGLVDAGHIQETHLAMSFPIDKSAGSVVVRRV